MVRGSGAELSAGGRGHLGCARPIRDTDHDTFIPVFCAQPALRPASGFCLEVCWGWWWSRLWVFWFWPHV